MARQGRRPPGTSRLKLPPKEGLRFALLGAGYHLCALARMLVEQGFPRPVIVTHPRPEHERDRLLLKGEDLYEYVFDVARDLGIEVIEAATVNDAGLIARLKELSCAAAFSLSCRSIIKGEFIRSFEGRVFNLHPSMLPRERGGGTFSWRIMNQQKEVSASLHLIDEGIDTGGILFQSSRQISGRRPTPRDFLVETNRVYVSLLRRFLGKIDRGETLAVRAQDESKATYLPRLHTETNAAIDWSWSGAEIERFIRAFAAPYPGAFTYCGKTRIAVLDADLERAALAYHPYASGRVLSRLGDGSVRVIVGGGLLRIRALAVESEPRRPADVLGDRSVLGTPSEILEGARTAVVPVSRMAPPKVVG